MTVIFELDLDIHPVDHHAKNQDRASVHSARRGRSTDIQTEPQYLNNIRNVIHIQMRTITQEEIRQVNWQGN